MSITYDVAPLEPNWVQVGPLYELSHKEKPIKSFTPHEVKLALFSFGDDTNPRLDRHTVGFFKNAWLIVGDDLTQAVIRFMQNDKLLVD